MTKILVAEDEKDIRELIAFTLRFAGYDVVLANNGAEALQKVAEERPALILLDVRMPKMTGYEVCRRLKENPQTEDIPVVFLSAKGQDREVQEGFESGAVDYIIKPFVPDELIAQVKRILEQTG
ncbi:MAG TPA: response regulator [Chloroflexi bacterium]|nr:response regulator [Chloroflexota bacterium]